MANGPVHDGSDVEPETAHRLTAAFTALATTELPASASRPERAPRPTGDGSMNARRRWGIAAGGLLVAAAVVVVALVVGSEVSDARVEGPAASATDMTPTTPAPERPSTELPGRITVVGTALDIVPVDVSTADPAVPQETAAASISQVFPLGPEYHAYLARNMPTGDPTLAGAPPPGGQLVWAFIATGDLTEGGLSGPVGSGPLSGTKPTVASGTTCRSVWLADAATGSYIFGVSSCTAPGDPTTPTN